MRDGVSLYLSIFGTRKFHQYLPIIVGAVNGRVINILIELTVAIS